MKKQFKKPIAKLLAATAMHIEKKGIPNAPIIIQSDPSMEECMFLVVWKHDKISEHATKDIILLEGIYQ